MDNCLKPLRICTDPREGATTYVACRSCALCRDNYVKDWVGRCLAEQAFSSHVFAVTLTYAGDGPETVILRFSDVQKFLKRLRFEGFSVRYLVAGEYGTKKGRCHWHVILFFNAALATGRARAMGGVPDVPLDRRVNWPLWSHGFSYFQNPDYKGFRYVLKYALKDVTPDSGSIRTFSQSRKPVLGTLFFLDRAERYAKAGLVPADPNYSFLDVRTRDKTVRHFAMHGAALQSFVDRYLLAYEEYHGKEPPYSDWLFEQVEARAKDAVAIQKADARRLERQALYTLGRHPLGFLSLSTSIDDCVIPYSDNSADIWIGHKKWHVAIQDATKGNAALIAQLSDPNYLGLPYRVWFPLVNYLMLAWRNGRQGQQKDAALLRSRLSQPFPGVE